MFLSVIRPLIFLIVTVCCALAQDGLAVSLAMSPPRNTVSFQGTILPHGQVGSFYRSDYQATGGSLPYTYSVAGGSLPSGLSIDSSTGNIFGIPASAGNFTFLLQARDATGATAQGQMSLAIESASPVTITNASLPDALVNVLYSHQLNAAGGTPPYRFAFGAGSLPPGLSLSSSGVINGVAQIGVRRLFNVIATDQQGRIAIRSYELNSKSTGLSFITTTLPAAQVGVPFSFDIQVAGAGPFVFQLAGSPLPSAIALSPQGRLSGTPLSAGIFSFGISVTDSQGISGQATFSLTVSAAPGQSPNNVTILTFTVPNARFDTPYSFYLRATASSGLTTFTLIDGRLPRGISLASDGLLSGRSEEVGIFQFTFQVRDQVNPLGRTSAAIVLTSLSANLGFGNSALPKGQIGRPYVAPLQVANSLPPWIFDLGDGRLPQGLSLSAQGLISGIPRESGEFPLYLRVTDAARTTVTQFFLLTIDPAGLGISTNSLPQGRSGADYRANIVAIGGAPPYVYSIVEGRLPAGLEMNSNGIITGRPDGVGSYNFTVQVRDSQGAQSRVALLLFINGDMLSIQPDSIVDGQKNQPFSLLLRGAGGSGPYGFRLATGSLPPGTTISSTGLLSGTPTQSGDFSFQIQLSDQNGNSAPIQRNWRIRFGSPEIRSGSLPDGVVDSMYSGLIRADADLGTTLGFSVVGGALPPGILLEGNGRLTGIPQRVGAFDFTVEVRDGQGRSNRLGFRIQVVAVGGPLSVASLAPRSAVLFQNYEQRIVGSGGALSYEWRVRSGSLPPGLSLDSSRGLLRGAPLAEGQYSFTLNLRDSQGGSLDLPSYNLTVSEALRLERGRVGQLYSVQMTFNGRIPVSLELDPMSIGGLPPGITLAAGGVLRGTPTAAGEFTFVVNAGGADGVITAYAVTIPIGSGEAQSPLVSFLPGATVGRPYRQSLMTTNDTLSENAMLLSGNLPMGLRLNSTNGVIEGIPVQTGDYFFVLQLRNSGNVQFRLSVFPQGAPVLAAVVNAASYVRGGVAPGLVLTLFGESLGPDNLVTASLIDGRLASELNGTRVLFDGQAAPLLYASSGQLGVLVPFSLLGRVNTSVTVERNNAVSAPYFMPILGAQPGIFTQDGSGVGLAALLNEDGTLNGPENPAAKGSIVVLFATGGGRMTPGGVDGRVADAISSLVLPLEVQIGDLPAPVLYGGNAPGLVQGVIQVNARVPASLPAGAQPIRFGVGGILSRDGVVLWVRE